MLTLLALLPACQTHILEFSDGLDCGAGFHADADACVANVDTGVDTDPRVVDGDGDGFSGTDDCDDEDRTVNPAAAEVCDGLDQDCDGDVDEGLATFAAAPDVDGDTFGETAAAEVVCALPEGWVTDTSDCADADPTVFPGQLESCNGHDDDCDDLVDDDDSPVYDATVWYADVDADGHGDGDERVTRCDAPDGYTDSSDDCDDGDDTINPDRAETCLDLIDQDCDGYTDDYTGPCGSSEETGEIDLCDPTISAANVKSCSAGIAAVLPSGVGYTTVQDAMDAAAPGDVVTVCPGTWTEDLVQNVSPLSLVGFGAGTSVLSGASGTVVAMGTGQTLTVVDLSVENGTGYAGGGLSGTDATLCVARSTFALNLATGGGAVHLAGTGTVEIEDTEFYANTAGSSGGAVNFGTYAVTIEDTSFIGNTAAYDGGAATIDSTSTVTMRSTTFTSNTADYTAGAVHYGGWGPAQSMDLTDVTFTDNATNYEGGALNIGDWDDPTVTCYGCVFESNSAATVGGAVNMNSWDAGTFTAVLSTFVGNDSYRGGAVALGAWGSPSAVFEGCEFEQNTAEYGGAFSLDPADTNAVSVTITDSSVTTNTAASGCGGAEIDASASTMLVSSNTDWGTGGTENSPDDVCGYSAYGAGSSFTCTGGVCF